MSVQSVLARIAEIEGRPPPAQVGTTTAAGGAQPFSSVLGAQAAATGGVTAPAALGGGNAGANMVRIAEGQVGVSEQPPGSNDGPRIAQYRSATAGAGVGPWCAYFVSWVARQAGTPLGEQGQGFGSVSAVYGWAQRTGRAEPASYRPKPGDLIVWGGEHIGLVESVDANGAIHTIEGNSSDAVSRRTYGADGGGATGYVRMS